MIGVAELATFAGSGILSGAMEFLADWRADSQRRWENDQLHRDKNAAEVSKAREMQTTPVSCVRRLFAFAGVFILVFPLLAPMIPASDKGMKVAVAYSQLHPGNLFKADREAIHWTVSDGVIVSPMHNMVAVSLIGFYFGGAAVRRR